MSGKVVLPDEILAMKPGKRMDFLIADKVMELIAWEEKRGEYLHVTFQRQGEREPYRRSRDWEEAAKRFRQISFSEIDSRKHIVHEMKEFTTEISAAWEVFQNIHGRLFSRRRRFMEALQEMTLTDNGNLIAWPDVLWTVTPERIAKAALLAVMVA